MNKASRQGGAIRPEGICVETGTGEKIPDPDHGTTEDLTPLFAHTFCTYFLHLLSIGPFEKTRTPTGRTLFGELLCVMSGDHGI